MIVTIDGLSGVGKGTLSNGISKYFKIKYLETGNLYRIISSKCIEYKINITRYHIPILSAFEHSSII